LSADREGVVDLVRRVPKAEIHLHLEGSADLEVLLEILRSRGERAGPEARARLAPLYAHRDFPGFLQNFRLVCQEIRRPEDLGLVATGLSRRLQGEGVRYAEVFCSPAVFKRLHGLPALEVMDAVSAAARRREKDGGPRLRFLLDGVRQFGVEGMEENVEWAIACRAHDVIGIGMGGDESSAPTGAFAGPYREARRRGLRTTVHAGEFGGPRSVWEAIEILEVERIGHGVRAVEDPELLRVLARLGVPLECCPTSNVRTGVAPGWERHPIADLVRAGACVTVSSDDPAMFSTTLVGEWEALQARLGLEAEEVLAIGVRTARSTFLPEAEKEVLAAAMLEAAAGGPGAPA
jgi:adenosine deaminase